MHIDDLRKKYPKWAHRRDVHRARRRKSRRRRRRRRRPPLRQSTDVTNILLMQLLNQITGTQIVQPSKKHGSNVVSGYMGAVRPDRLAPVRAQDDRGRILQQAGMRQMQQQMRQQAIPAIVL